MKRRHLETRSIEESTGARLKLQGNASNKQQATKEQRNKGTKEEKEEREEGQTAGRRTKKQSSPRGEAQKNVGKRNSQSSFMLLTVTENQIVCVASCTTSLAVFCIGVYC